MLRRAFLAGMAAALLAAAPGSLADEIREGAVLEVRADSIWFEDAAKLARWQDLRKSGDAAAFEAYEQEALSHREAWQFTKPLSVKVLSYEPGNNRVSVELQTPGRLQGSTWLLDADALLH